MLVAPFQSGLVVPIGSGGITPYLRRTRGAGGASPLLTSLISYWKLDEASGNAIDSIGSNTLTDNNAVGSTTGKIATARQFVAASNQSLSIASNADLQTGDIDFTLSLWVNFAAFSGSYNGLAGKWFSGNEYLVYRNSNRFRFSVRSSASVTTNLDANTFGAPSTGTWYHVIASHDSINDILRIRINGGTADTLSYSGGVRTSTGTFMLGQEGTSPSSLTLDEVGFWKRVLTPTEELSLYNSGSGLAYPF